MNMTHLCICCQRPIPSRADEPVEAWFAREVCDRDDCEKRYCRVCDRPIPRPFARGTDRLIKRSHYFSRSTCDRPACQSESRFPIAKRRDRKQQNADQYQKNRKMGRPLKDPDLVVDVPSVTIAAPDFSPYELDLPREPLFRMMRPS